ncbi:MAG: RagB/SusD family nutrient uptake outer membrane protein [Alistipes finegoldii]
MERRRPQRRQSRHRNDPQPRTPGLSENLSRDGLRSALRYERMVELCNEGFRWFDIRRWDMAESVISGTLYAPALDGSVSNAVPTIDSDGHVTYNGQTFDGKDMNLRRFITMSYDPMKDACGHSRRAHRQSADTQNPGYAGHSIEE